ncbi:MAG: acyl-CoA dehydrogenase [Dehalococcoidia bacterium]|nr:MAG: acyl-CoA dehydrogenase [Dehalococcoidia bacterium]
MCLSFEISAEQKELKGEVAKLAQRLSSKVDEWERRSVPPRDRIEELAERRWMGPIVPLEYDGMGRGAMEYSIISEELARFGLFGPQPTIQAEKHLLASGTEEQKASYLPKLARGEYIAAIAISEATVGSSFELMETTAVKRGDSYILNGHKSHINFAADAAIMLLYAKTEDGLSIFVIEKGTPGINFKKGDPIGQRMQPIYDFTLKNVEIPETHLLGKAGDAMATFFAAFNLSRIGNASCLIGLARGALGEAIEYARERSVGRNLVTDFQGIRWMVAELVTKIEAAALLRDKAAWLEDEGVEHALETAMARYYAAEVAEEVASRVFSLVGGWGCYRERPFERFWRDAKVGKLAGGSSEVLKNLIARRVLGRERGPSS